MNKINELIESYIDYLRFERLLSLNTIYSYKRDLAKLVLFLEQNNISDLQGISNDDILNFLEHLYQSQSDRSVSRILSSIRSFCRYLLRSGKILKNPFGHIKNPKVPRKDADILNQAEISGFLENIACSTYLELRDRAMFELLYSCGMRVSEIVNLRLNDINIEEGLIRFIGKGSKERITPIGETAKNFLIRYLDSSRCNIEREIKSDYVF
jgi:integrase/recombinase XerD